MTDERTLPQARKNLENAVASLIDPRPERHDNRTVWVGSVYTELRAAIYGHRAGSARQPAEPQPPLWIDGVVLGNEIDSTVTRWVRNGRGPSPWPTVNRLRLLLMRKWRPQDTDTITEITEQITGWVKRYAALTDRKPLTLPNPCPKCGKSFAYRQQDGEQLRVPALHVTLERCVCMACHITWPAERFGLLARELGYDPLPGVLT